MKMYLLAPTADSLKHLIQKQRYSLQRISVKCIYLNYIIVLSFYLSSFNFRHRNHYRMCMENVTDCKLGFSQTEDMKFKCILNISPNHNLSTDFYKFLNSIYRYTTIPISVFVGYLEGYSFSHSCRINSQPLHVLCNCLIPVFFMIFSALFSLTPQPAMISI